MCDARLWGLPDGLICVIADESHVTHRFEASAVGDGHDLSEQRAEDAR